MSTVRPSVRMKQRVSPYTDFLILIYEMVTTVPCYVPVFKIGKERQILHMKTHHVRL